MAEGAAALAVLASLVRARAGDRAHEQKICLFLGAGADISSGGLTFAELKRSAIERFAARALFEVTPTENVDRDFDALFVRLEADERALMIKAIFEEFVGVRPSEAYLLLVLLVEAGGIDALVTTNFDEMLERAQAHLGRDVLQVYAPGSTRPYDPPLGAYAPQKRPYVKLHGDLAARTVTRLVPVDLEATTYDPDTLALLRSIVATHDLVFAGYGGFDEGLAQVLADAAAASTARIFWCNPSPPRPEAPLVRRLGPRLRHIASTFDQLVLAIARPVLEKPSLKAIEPTFVTSLFDWRVDYCNKEYASQHERRAHRDMVAIFARRRHLEDALGRFLAPNKPLALVTGPSGYGKSILGLRLLRAWQTRETTRLMLLEARGFLESTDLEEHLSQRLGGLGSRSSFSLHRLERWLADRNVQLVVYIDGVNEFSDDLRRCAAFLKGIVRFCYFLPETNSAIRIVATIRQETWESMLPLLDAVQLHSVAWSPAGAGKRFTTLACDAFSEEELRDAVDRLGSPSLTVQDLDAMSAVSLERLKDPYLLRVVAETSRTAQNVMPSASQVKAMVDAKLKTTATVATPAFVQHALARAAKIALDRREQIFRELDLDPSDRKGDILRLVLDLDLVKRADKRNYLKFDHDRTFEFFLAVAISDGLGPRLETREDLEAYLRKYAADARALGAARVYLELNPKLGLDLIAKVFARFEPSRGGAAVDRRVYDFAREILVQLAEAGEPSTDTYLADTIDAAGSGVIGELHLRAVVQATAALPMEASIPLLGRAGQTAPALPRTEAQIYAIDRLASLLLDDGLSPIDLLATEPFASYFAQSGLAPWQSIGRVLSLAAQLGPDNTNIEEYARVSATMLDALRRSMAQRSPSAAEEFAAFFLGHCDRLMFNATSAGVARFFANEQRGVFLEILDKIAAGHSMTLADFRRLEPFASSIDYDVEYHIVAALLVLSSLHDKDAVLDLIETVFSGFADDANPVEIDFLEEVLVYVHVLHGLDYDEPRFARWEERILADWPGVLLHRPGVKRGERRGFIDEFDRVFEDGFGVIYPYGILSPSRRRKAMAHAAYLQAALVTDNDPLPLYRRFLERFLAEGRLDEALQLIQAIGGVIVTWPIEGLSALRPAIGHAEPRIRRAVVRVLAEAYNRHREATMRSLRVAGVALTDEDLLEIRVRSDARLGRRQVSEEEYARIGHLLLRLNGAKRAAIDVLAALLMQPSFEAAVAAIFERLGFTARGD